MTIKYMRAADVRADMKILLPAAGFAVVQQAIVGREHVTFALPGGAYIERPLDYEIVTDDGEPVDAES